MSLGASISTTDALEGARAVARLLHQDRIGGPCYLGGHHTCFARQGRKPLPLYHAEQMCECCQATWHALMAAYLLESLLIGQRFAASASAAVESAPTKRTATSAQALVETVNTRMALEQGRSSGEKTTTEEFSCDRCDRTFTKKNTLTMHKRYCKGGGAKKRRP